MWWGESDVYVRSTSVHKEVKKEVFEFLQEVDYATKLTAKTTVVF